MWCCWHIHWNTLKQSHSRISTSTQFIHPPTVLQWRTPTLLSMRQRSQSKDALRSPTFWREVLPTYRPNPRRSDVLVDITLLPILRTNKRRLHSERRNKSSFLLLNRSWWFITSFHAWINGIPLPKWCVLPESKFTTPIRPRRSNCSRNEMARSRIRCPCRSWKYYNHQDARLVRHEFSEYNSSGTFTCW